MALGARKSGVVQLYCGMKLGDGNHPIVRKSEAASQRKLLPLVYDRLLDGIACISPGIVRENVSLLKSRLISFAHVSTPGLPT